MANLDNATTAPVIGGEIFCKHQLAAILAVPIKGLTPRTRIQKFLAKHNGDVAIARRAWKAYDLVLNHSVKLLDDGSAEVGGNANWTYHVHDHMCECPDYQGAYAALIAEKQANGTLPPAPVE